MDAQMVINSPALSGGTSVRGPHLDQPDKLISGLLYLRSAGEDSVGGELQLYAPATRKLTFDDTNLASGDSVRVVRTYPYRHNLLVLPFCSPVAIHGVSPRGQTPNSAVSSPSGGRGGGAAVRCSAPHARAADVIARAGRPLRPVN